MEKIQIQFIIFLTYLDLYSSSLSVKKCCPENEVLDIHYKTCRPAPQNNKLGFFQNITFPLLPLDEHGQIPFLSIPFNGTYELNCPVKDRLLYNGSRKSNVLFSKDRNSGYRTYNLLSGRVEYEAETFCLDWAFKIEDEDSYTAFALVCSKCDGPCVSVCHQSDIDGKPLALKNKTYQKVYVEQHCDEKNIYQYKESHFWYDDASRRMVVDGTHRNLSEYCLHQEEGEKGVSLHLCLNEFYTNRKIFKIVLSLISFFSLAILIIIHILVREFREQIGPRIKCGVFWNLMILYLVLAISNSKDFKEDYSSCLTIGLAIQFFGLSMFCWMTCISFDLWNRLRYLRRIDESAPTNIQWYFLFSVGFPFLMFVLTLTIQLRTSRTPSLETYLPPPRISGILADDVLNKTISLPQYFIHPGIGEDSCFLHNYLPMLLYFHLPVLIMLLINLFMFISLAHGFFCGVWKPRSQEFRSNNYKQKIDVLSKMFLFMGINWIAEIVVFILNWNNVAKYVIWLTYILDTFNLITGALFLVHFLQVLPNRELLKKALVELKVFRGDGLLVQNRQRRVLRPTTQMSELEQESGSI